MLWNTFFFSKTKNIQVKDFFIDCEIWREEPCGSYCWDWLKTTCPHVSGHALSSLSLPSNVGLSPVERERVGGWQLLYDAQ